jgi:DNA-binding NarL/FixJ family response regulator
MITEAIATQRPRSHADRRREKGRLHVLVADHDGLARSMMREALSEVDTVSIVTTAGDCREALDLARYYCPSVMVVETRLPPDGGVELTRKVLESGLETRVVTVSVDDDDGALAGLRAGAIGHISKDVSPEELAERVVRAAQGETIIPQRLIAALLEMLREIPEAGWRPLRSRLTTREWEIVELIGDGESTQEIAEHLVLSPTTVYSHVKSVMRKLGVHSRQQAVGAAQCLRREEALGTKAPHQLATSSPEPVASDGKPG